MPRDNWRHHRRIRKKIKDDLRFSKRTFDSYQLDIGTYNWIIIDRRYDIIF